MVRQGHGMRWENTATALSALRPVSRLGHSFLADRSRKSVRFKLFFFQTWWISQEMMKFKFSKFNFSIWFITKRWSSTWFPHLFPGGRVFHLRWPPSHRDCDGDRLSDLRHRGAARTKRNRLPNAASRSAEVTYLQPNATCCWIWWVGFWCISDGFLPLVASFNRNVAAKSCDFYVAARCRTSSRWKPATRTLARGWGSQIKDEVDGLLGT